jgi:hypothetical protein
VANFKCSGTTVGNKNFIQEEVKRKLKRGNACCHSIQKFLSSSVLYENLKIKTYRSITVPFVLYGHETFLSH